MFTKRKQTSRKFSSRLAMHDDHFLVSGWDDDLQNIDQNRNPDESIQRELLQAAEDGDLDKLNELIKSDSTIINSTDKDGYTALHRACYSDKPEVVRYLLRNGANIHAKTEFGWTPLHSCCQWNHTYCAVILIENGADVNAVSEGSQTPLHIAASHGASYGTVQLLLMHPYINADLKNNSNETALDIAKRNSKYYNIFEMADPNIVPNNFQK